MLKQQIQVDIINALKQGNQEVVDVLRMAISAVNLKEKEKRYKVSKEDTDIKEEDLMQASALNDDEVISVISSEIKKRKDAIVLYKKGNRQELVDKEKKEIEILQKYLPEQLSLEEIRKLIEESIANVGATNIKEMGKVMADLAPKVKGKADGGLVSGLVKQKLS